MKLVVPPALDQPPPPGYRVHHTSGRESLLTLAQAFGISVEQLRSASNVPNFYSAHTVPPKGFRLCVPKKEAEGEAAAGGGGTSSVLEAGGGHAPIHQVREGDTVEGLCEQHGISEEELRSWNRVHFPLGFKGALFPGQVLVVKRVALG